MRGCGECTLCCYITLVPEIGKKRYVQCPQCSGDKCSIYSTRPDACRKYSCRWASEEWEESLWPNKCHTIFETLPNCSIYVALIDPRVIDNVDEMNRIWPPVEQKIFNIVESGISVVAGTPKLRRVYSPKGVSQMSVLLELQNAYKKYMEVKT